MVTDDKWYGGCGGRDGGRCGGGVDWVVVDRV